MALFAATLINEQVFKPIFKQPRPELACIDSYGMPSGHATLSGVYFVWAIYCYVTKIGNSLNNTLAMCIFTINNGYSRIYLHYHTVQQVEWGFIWGVSFALVYFIMVPMKSTPKAKKMFHRFRTASIETNMIIDAEGSDSELNTSHESIL